MSGFEDTSDFFKSWKNEVESAKGDTERDNERNKASNSELSSFANSMPAQPPMFRNDLPPAHTFLNEMDNNQPEDGTVPFFLSALEKAKLNKPYAAPQENVIANSGSVVVDNPIDVANRDRRDRKQTGSRTIGNVVSCNGSSVVIAANFTGGTFAADAWTVGQMISIVGDGGRIVALVREIASESAHWDENEDNAIAVKADMVGEVGDDIYGKSVFKRGISKYPKIGAIAHKIRTSDLESIFDLGDRIGVEIGQLSQNNEIPAIICVDDILKRHFAIVGTTGVGKSCAVSLVISEALKVDNNLRVLMLDPHNEFGGAFGAKAHQLDASTIDLPYWVFNYEEIEDVIFRGHPKAEESDILRELILIAKHERAIINASMANQSPNSQLSKQIKPPQSQASLSKLDATLINIDSPVPYRIADVLRLIDEISGQLEPRFSRIHLRSLKVRLEMLEANPRYKFLFLNNGFDDCFERIIADIFRLPANGKPMTTVNLSGLPSEVINCVASVLARLAFDVAHASNGAIKVLLVCEEAHRYVPSDRSLSFEPTRRAISRIAKEGRKYGCAIAIVTQRPGELDPTILSQCSTIFAMRLANELDQEIIRSALSDSSAAVVSFLASLDNREAIAFGEGVQVPMRLHFNNYDIAKMRKEYGYRKETGNNINADKVNTNDLIKSIRGISSQMVHHEINQNNINPPSDNQIRSQLVRRPLAEALKNENIVKEVEALNKAGSNTFGTNGGLRR